MGTGIDGTQWRTETGSNVQESVCGAKRVCSASTAAVGDRTNTPIIGTQFVDILTLSCRGDIDPEWIADSVFSWPIRMAPREASCQPGYRIVYKKDRRRRTSGALACTAHRVGSEFKIAFRPVGDWHCEASATAQASP